MNTRTTSIATLLLSLCLASSAGASAISSFELALQSSFESYQRGDLEESIRHMERAARHAGDLNPLTEGSALRDLASLYHLAGRHDDALSPSQQAVVLIEDSLGAGHVDHVEATAELALAHIMLGQLTAARELLQHASSVVESESHPSYDLARTTIDTYLADIHMREGDAGRALPLYRRSLVLLRRMPTVSRGIVALLHDRLAWAEIAARRDYVQAERHLTDAASVFEWYWSRQQEVREQQWAVNGVSMASWPLVEHRERTFLGRAGTLLPHALRSLAAVQFERGKVDDALTTLEQLRRLTPDAVDEDRSTVADLRVLEGLIRTSTLSGRGSDGPADRLASDRCATMPLSIAAASGYVTRQPLDMADPLRMVPSVSQMVRSVSRLPSNLGRSSRFGGSLR